VSHKRPLLPAISHLPRSAGRSRPFVVLWPLGFESGSMGVDPSTEFIPTYPTPYFLFKLRTSRADASYIHRRSPELGRLGVAATAAPCCRRAHEEARGLCAGSFILHIHIQYFDTSICLYRCVCSKRIHYFLYIHMYFHAVSSDHDFARISNFQRRDRSFRHSPPFIEFQTLKTSVRFWFTDKYICRRSIEFVRCHQDLTSIDLSIPTAALTLHYRYTTLIHSVTTLD
jgi:hypothetical protein